MNAKQLIDEYLKLFGGGPAAPTKPTTKPATAPPKPAEPRPGTKPWKIPTIKPGTETAPKAKKEEDKD